MLKQKALQHQPLLLVETCLLLHDVESVLDRHGDALYHARLARTVMRRLDRGDYPRNHDRFDHYTVNVPYAEAVTLTTIGLPLPATDRVDAALADATRMDTAGTFWLPHLYRHRLEAFGGLARFSQHDARAWATHAKRACERRRDPLDAQVSLLIDMSLARAYLRYDRRAGNESALNKAYRLLRPEIESLQTASYFGPTHRLSILNTYASICWRKQDYDEWAHYIHEALALALAAGLQHQVRKIWAEYGEALLPLGYAENVLNPGEARLGPFLPGEGT